MPYVGKDSRVRYEAAIQALVLLIRHAPPGELNYVITKISTAWLDSIKPCGYTEFAMAIGVLETCKLEMQKRLLEPYESRKKSENGDTGYELFEQEKSQ